MRGLCRDHHRQRRAAAFDARLEDCGLRVRSSPTGLAVTAANNLRHGLKSKLSYSGEAVRHDLSKQAITGQAPLLGDKLVAGRLVA
jgi:hypothetical protein